MPTPDLMLRARGARVYLDTLNRDTPEGKACELQAFLSIFHPRMSKRQVQEMVDDVRGRVSRRRAKREGIGRRTGASSR